MPKLLRFPDLKDRGIPFTRQYLSKLERLGRFPKRIPIGERTVGWDETEIAQFVADKVAARSVRKARAPTKRAALKDATL